jgi:TPR repeat protein
MAGLKVRSWRALLLAAAVLGQPFAATAAQDSGPKNAARDTVALAMQYETGLSVPRDYGRAMTLYCEAARRGDPRAFYAIGWMYLNGRGVARDDETAAMWLRKAADRGVTQAVNILQLISRVSPARAQDCPSPTATRRALGTIHPRASAPPAIRSVIDETAQHVGINTRLLHSVVLVESGFDPRAVSPKMAAGLMQLMPETAARFGVRDRFDPRENVHAGAKYLRLLIDKYNGSLTLALAAYNAGEKAVEAHGGVPPYQETKTYVDAIKRLCGCGE